jgi:hypothetical protein
MIRALKVEMDRACQELEAFHKDESGDVIQFIALTALILIMLVGGWFVLKPLIKNNFTNAETQLQRVNSESY